MSYFNVVLYVEEGLKLKLEVVQEISYFWDLKEIQTTLATVPPMFLSSEYMYKFYEISTIPILVFDGIELTRSKMQFQASTEIQKDLGCYLNSYIYSVPTDPKLAAAFLAIFSEFIRERCTEKLLRKNRSVESVITESNGINVMGKFLESFFDRRVYFGDSLEDLFWKKENELTPLRGFPLMFNALSLEKSLKGTYQENTLSVLKNLYMEALDIKGLKREFFLTKTKPMLESQAPPSYCGIL